ncbi:MAG TPA: glycosyltransferase family 1 protein [Saccharofermentans sp.]|nr:glycosyltransferase family 1 protein [Saccharofermentans sp.]
MRVAIDLTATPKNKTGIGRYMLGLLKGLQESDNENEYILFAQDDDLDGFGVYKDNFKFVPVNHRILRKQWIRVLWEQIVLPFRIRKQAIDVLHCPNFTMPYFLRLFSHKTAVVGTLHDMTYFFLPEYHVGWKREMFKAYIKMTSKACDKVITISQNSKADIAKYCKLRNKDVSVTYMGVKEKFFDTAPASDSTLQNYGIDSKFILYVGTLEPRKNIPGLIEGYAGLSDQIRDEYKLVIIGKKGWLYEEIFETVSKDSRLKDKIVFTGYVADEDMIPLMRASSVFAYVSFYEGFGIPVIEGMASRKPVVTSIGSSIEEIASGFGFLCDPKNTKTITKALDEAIAEDKAIERCEEQALLRLEKQCEHAKMFSWKECGKNSIKAYEEAYEVRNGK